MPTNGLVLRSALPLLLMSCPAFGAEPYRFELRGEYSAVDSDFISSASSVLGTEIGIGDDSTNGLQLEGDYFFRPIEARDGPLREAAFLERASALSFSVLEARTDGDRRSSGLFGDFTSTFDTQASAYGLRYRFVGPQKPWIGTVGYEYADDATSQLGTEWESERTGYSFGFGRYVGPRTSVTAEYGRSRLESMAFIGTLPTLRSETLSVGVHSVLPLGKQRYLGVTAALRDTSITSADDSVGTYELGVAFYPRNDVSIALSAVGEYHAPAFPDRDRYEYALEANWFVTPSLAVELGYETSVARVGFSDPLGLPSESKDDSSGLRLGFSWRR